MNDVIFIGQSSPDPKLAGTFFFKAYLTEAQMEELKEKLSKAVNLHGCDIKAYINIEVNKYDT